MRIRDAVESDAQTLATTIGRPQDAVLDMIHDRSVRVAVSDESRGGDSDGGRGGDSDEGRGGDSDSDRKAGSNRGAIDGFVAFDVHGGTVHVTDFDGDEQLVHRLFEEPLRFASREEMAVEVVIPDDEGSGPVIDAIGFESVGAGPRFEGRATTRYRIESGGIE